MDASFDLVIRGGTIVDGTGQSPFVADIAVAGGRIVQVGQVDGRGGEEIDAAGHTVTPGFVDMHTHYDGQITWESRLVPSSNHGVTTVVMGNCGVGFAPARPTDHKLMVKLMEGVEDIPEVVMTEGVPFNWESFPEYLDALDKRHADLDFATQLPHSPLRVFVMGERGANLEPPTQADLDQMRRIGREAIEAGALGISSSRNLFHRFRSGALAPSVKTERDELLALAGGLKDAGTGVFQINPNLDNDAEAEMAIFRDIARASGRPLNFSLISMPSRPENWDRYVKELEAAEHEGLQIRAQFLPRPMGVLYGLELTFNPFALTPSFREIEHLPLAGKVAQMREPAFRARMIAEEPTDPNPVFVAMVKMAVNLFPLGDPANYHPQPEDMLPEKARRLGMPLKEMLYDELLKDDGHAILCLSSTPIPEYKAMTLGLIGRANAIMALGDGGAHYGMICDAAYTTYLLTQRLGEEGLGLPKLIRAMTRQPAEAVGLLDRGLLAQGMKADLNVLDLDRLTLHRPMVTDDLPAKGRRLSQRSHGYVATIVSGVITRRNDAQTGALPGRLIRGAQALPTTEKSLLAA